MVSYDYPDERNPGLVQMNPKPFGSSLERYRHHQRMAFAEPDVTFIGRLATDKQLDMDDCVLQAITILGQKLKGGFKQSIDH